MNPSVKNPSPAPSKRDVLCAAYAELQALEQHWLSDAIPQHPDLPKIRAVMLQAIREHQTLLHQLGFHRGMAKNRDV